MDKKPGQKPCEISGQRVTFHKENVDLKDNILSVKSQYLEHYLKETWLWSAVVVEDSAFFGHVLCIDFLMTKL